MEAPEKIYIHPDIGGREFLRPWLRRAANNESIEYTRTDVIVERAIGWIDDNNRNGGCYFEGWENDFKNYMKGD